MYQLVYVEILSGNIGSMHTCLREVYVYTRAWREWDPNWSGSSVALQSRGGSHSSSCWAPMVMISQRNLWILGSRNDRQTKLFAYVVIDVVIFCH